MKTSKGKRFFLHSLTVLMALALGASVGCGEDVKGKKVQNEEAPAGIIKPPPLPTEPTPGLSRPTAEDAGAVSAPPPATAPAEADPAGADPARPVSVFQDKTVAPCPKRPTASAPAGEPWAEPQIFEEQSETGSWNFSADIKFDALKWFFERISDAQAVIPASGQAGAPVDKGEMNIIDRPLSADPVAETPPSPSVEEMPTPAPVAEPPAPPSVAEAPAPAPVEETPVPPSVAEPLAPAPVVETLPPPSVAETPPTAPVVEAPAPAPVAETPAPPSESAPEYRVVVGPETPLTVYQEETVEDIRVSFSGMRMGPVIDHRHKDLTLTFCPTLQFDDPQCVGFLFDPLIDGNGDLIRSVGGYGWETGALVNYAGNDGSGDIPLDRLKYFRLSLRTGQPAVSIPGIKVEVEVAGKWRPLYFNPYLRDSVRPARDLIFGPDDTAVVFTVETGGDLGAGTDDDVRLFFPKTDLDPQLELYNQSQDLARPHFEIRDESISMVLDWPETDDFERDQSGTYSAYFFNGDPIGREFFIEKTADDNNGGWQIGSYDLIVFRPGDPLFFETERCHVTGGGPFNDVWLEAGRLRHPWRGQGWEYWEVIPEGPCSPLTNEMHNNWPSGPAVER